MLLLISVTFTDTLISGHFTMECLTVMILGAGVRNQIPLVGITSAVIGLLTCQNHMIRLRYILYGAIGL